MLDDLFERLASVLFWIFRPQLQPAQQLNYVYRGKKTSQEQWIGLALKVAQAKDKMTD